jgi:hypothetical protein
MTYYKRPLIVYKDPQGRIFVHEVWIIPFPIPQRNEFILNYRREKLHNRLLYSIHFKATPMIDLQDYNDYENGDILEIIDCSHNQVYPTPYLRPMLTLLYGCGFNGYGLN